MRLLKLLAEAFSIVCFFLLFVCTHDLEIVLGLGCCVAAICCTRLHHIVFVFSFFFVVCLQNLPLMFAHFGVASFAGVPITSQVRKDYSDYYSFLVQDLQYA